MYTTLLYVMLGFPSPFAEPPATNLSKTNAPALLDPNQFTLRSRALDSQRINREFNMPGMLYPSRHRICPEAVIGLSPAEVAFLIGEREGGRGCQKVFSGGEEVSGDVVWYWKSGLTVIYVGGRATDAWSHTPSLFQFTGG